MNSWKQSFLWLKSKNSRQTQQCVQSVPLSKRAWIKEKGAVATLLVQQGTLNVQDPIVVGNTFGRVRAMTNDLGRRVKVAGPSTPVSITGLNEAPMAGDHFAVYEDEKSARAAGEERAKRALMKQRQATQRVSLENLFDTP